MRLPQSLPRCSARRVPRSLQPCGIPASMPSATTTFAMRYLARSATSPMKSGVRHGRVLEQYYTYLDAIVGRAMAAIGPDDLLLVVSGFGMEPLSLGKRVLERIAGDRELSGSHERAPDGFMHRLRPARREGQLPARVGRRRGADGAVFPRPADRARSGRLCPHRHLRAQLHGAAPDHVHSLLRPLDHIDLKSVVACILSPVSLRAAREADKSHEDAYAFLVSDPSCLATCHPARPRCS